jgi:hypothetical protein
MTNVGNIGNTQQQDIDNLASTEVDTDTTAFNSAKVVDQEYIFSGGKTGFVRGLVAGAGIVLTRYVTDPALGTEGIVVTAGAGANYSEATPTYTTLATPILQVVTMTDNANRTVTLAAPTALGTNVVVIDGQTDSPAAFTITVVPTGTGVTINGATSYVMSPQGPAASATNAATVVFAWNGSFWNTLSA